MVSGQDVRDILGRRIQFYRKQRQLSQAALAEKAGISITFLSKIERGLKYPTSDSLSGIANGLEVEPADLFQHDGMSAEYRNVFKRFKNDLTQRVLKTLDTVCKAYEE